MRQLDRIELDMDSPRLRLACHNLGISPKECLKKRREEFYYSPGKIALDEDVVELRFKHFRARQMDTINRVLEERKLISKRIEFKFYRIPLVSARTAERREDLPRKRYEPREASLFANLSYSELHTPSFNLRPFISLLQQLAINSKHHISDYKQQQQQLTATTVPFEAQPPLSAVQDFIQTGAAI